MPPPPSNKSPDVTRGTADPGRPTAAERAYLARGLDQPGGKLPLFDSQGQAYPPRLIRGCIQKGWAAPWFANPMKPDWLVCRLTDLGRAAVEKGPAGNAGRRGTSSWA